MASMTPQALAALAGYVRARLAELTLPPRRPAGVVSSLDGAPDRSAHEFATAVATAVVTAAAPFATSSYARTRLLRQLHATGLLADGEVDATLAVLAAAPPDRRAVPVRPLPRRASC